MFNNSKSLKRIFLLCLGLFIASAFCMKWMEADFLQNGKRFSILGLELGYDRRTVITILSGLEPAVKKILQYHLAFDFVFMIAVYPGIAVLCLLARIQSSKIQLRKILSVVAALQIVAWVCDILENYCLLKWINQPNIGVEFLLYHFIVVIKWLIAIGGAALGIITTIRWGRVARMFDHS